MHKNKIKYGFCLGIIIILLALSALTKEVVYSKLLVSFSIVIGAVIFFRLRVRTSNNQKEMQNPYLN